MVLTSGVKFNCPCNMESASGGGSSGVMATFSVGSASVGVARVSCVARSSRRGNELFVKAGHSAAYSTGCIFLKV